MSRLSEQSNVTAAVKTSVGVSETDIILMWDEPVDVVAYNPDAAEELANTILVLVKKMREGGASP